MFRDEASGIRGREPFNIHDDVPVFILERFPKLVFQLQARVQYILSLALQSHSFVK